MSKTSSLLRTDADASILDGGNNLNSIALIFLHEGFETNTDGSIFVLVELAGVHENVEENLFIDR